MTIESKLHSALNPCFQLAKLAHRELNAKAATQHVTVDQIIGNLTHVDKKPSQNVGALALAENVYDFFTKELYQSMSLTAQREQVESNRLLIKHELVNYKQALPINSTLSILSIFDRHISVLNDLSELTKDRAYGKIAIYGFITSVLAFKYLTSGPEICEPLPFFATVLTGSACLFHAAKFFINSNKQQMSVDYRLNPFSKEPMGRSVRDRLLSNYHSIVKLDLGFQK